MGMHRNAIVFGAQTALARAIARELASRGAQTFVARRWDETPAQPSANTRDVVATLESDDLVDILVGKNWVFLTTFPGLDLTPRQFERRAITAFRNLRDAAREAGIDRIVATLPASIAWIPGKPRLDEASRYVPGTARDPWVDAFYAVAQDLQYASADGVDTVVVAPALLVGPGVAPLRIGVPRDAHRVDVVDVGEAARMHVEAAASAPWGAKYLLGGRRVPRSSLPDLLPTPRRTGLLGRGGDDPRAHLVEPGVHIDPSRAIDDLGYVPR
jgi:nucleoside-diphosphate-sugar epimerase